MMPRKFLIYTIIIGITILLLSLTATFIDNTFNVIINNQLAVGQFENSDYTFMLMNLYCNIIKPIGTISLIIINFVLIFLEVINMYKLIKYFKEKEKFKDDKENS